MSDRGMKKWNAYKTLPEHSPAILEMQKSKYKVPKPIISNEEAEIINEILVHYQGETVELKIYKNEEIYTITTTIKKIDAYTRTLTLANDDKVKLTDLVGLKRV